MRMLVTIACIVIALGVLIRTGRRPVGRARCRRLHVSGSPRADATKTSTIGVA